MRVACGDQINELEVSVLERDNEWRERINSSECALAVEFEHARAFAGWGAFPFTPFLGGGGLTIALEGIQHREPSFFFLGW